MSLFEWLREGVRQAVVLGIADAVEDVGTRTRDEDFGPALARTLRDRLAVRPEPGILEPAAGAPAGTAGGRRRLGRSIEGLRKAA